MTPASIADTSPSDACRPAAIAASPTRRRLGLGLGLAATVALVAGCAGPGIDASRGDVVLPQDFPVWFGPQGVANFPYSGSSRLILPTVNHYPGPQGGYVAFYTHDPKIAVYPVGPDVHVVAMMRLPGRYVGRIFHPAGHGIGADIKDAPDILALADRYFPAYRGKLWIGGDTGGFVRR